MRAVLKAMHIGISDKTLQVTISRMNRRGRLHTIVKGVFSLQQRDELAGFAFSPFYYGGLAALMIMDFIDDQVKMEAMTTRRVKRSSVAIYAGASRIFLHHLPRRYYFGFRDVRYGDMIVPVSDPEKTLIDLFYYRVRLPIQDYSGILKAINGRKLAMYLNRYDRRIAARTLRFTKKYKPMADSGRLESPY